MSLVTVPDIRATTFKSLPPSSSRQPAFSINFIRREMFSLRLRRLGVLVLLGYLAVNVLLAVVLTGTAFVSFTQWQALSHRHQGAVVPAGAAGGVGQQMEAQAKEDLSRLTAMIGLQQARFPIAGKLAALTKTLPPRTWITKISGKHDSLTLAIRASYLVNPEEPFGLPTKAWMESLKADAYFSAGLKHLELKSSSRKKQGIAELVVLELAAEWQPLEVKK